MNELRKKGLLSRMAVPLMVLVFIAPMLGAWIVYNYFPDMVRTLGASNYGEFVVPPVKVDLVGQVDANRQALAEDLLNKNWTYVYFADNCDEQCLDRLTLIKNVRLTQGKEISRLKRLLVLKNDAINDGFKEKLESDYPGMQTLLLAEGGVSENFLNAFRFDGNPDPLQAGNIYIIDPDAKLMMYYKNDKEILKLGKGMQKDMSKLMHNSKLRK